MKIRIQKAEWEQLSDPIKALYEEKEEGIYQLKLEDDDELGGLVNSQKRLLEEKKRLAEERRKLEAKLAEVEAKAKEEELKRLEKEGDLEAIRNQIKADMEAKLEEERKAREAIEERYKKQLLDTEIKRITTALGGDAAAYLEPFVASRFELVEEDGNTRVVFKTAEGGEITDLDPEKIKEVVLKEKPLLSNFIKGRNSNGGGATGGGGQGISDSEAEKYFTPGHPEYSLTKQIEIQESNEALYKRLRAKFNLDDPMAAAAAARTQKGRPA